MGRFLAFIYLSLKIVTYELPKLPQLRDAPLQWSDYKDH